MIQNDEGGGTYTENQKVAALFLPLVNGGALCLMIALRMLTRGMERDDGPDAAAKRDLACNRLLNRTSLPAEDARTTASWLPHSLRQAKRGWKTKG